MNVDIWQPEWYGLTSSDTCNPEALNTERKRYAYLRLLVARLEADWGSAAPWKVAMNLETIQDARANWHDEMYAWPAWITADMEHFMAFLLGHIDFLNEFGPMDKAT